MDPDEYFDAWREATACPDAPEHYSKSTLEMHLPKLFEEKHFSGIEKARSGKDRALRALWDICGDAYLIARAVGIALTEDKKSLGYVIACLQNPKNSSRLETTSKKREAAGGEERPRTSDNGSLTALAASLKTPKAQPTASPQLENGYLRIAHEVWAHLMQGGLSGPEISLIMAVIRQTWGWKRKKAEISIAELCQMTSQPKSTATRVLQALVLRKILVVSRGGGRGIRSEWAFNKNWKAWLTVPQMRQLIKSLTDGTVLAINRPMDETVLAHGWDSLGTTDGTVSGCNPLQEQEQLAPKETIKETIKKEKKNPLNPPLGEPPKPVHSKLSPKELFEIWEAERGPLPPVAVPVPGSVTELVSYLNSSSPNGDDPRKGWAELIHTAGKCHPEHYSKMSPAWFSKDLEHVNQIVRGIYNHSFEKGSADGKGTGSRKGHIAGDRADFKKTTGPGFVPKRSV